MKRMCDCLVFAILLVVLLAGCKELPPVPTLTPSSPPTQEHSPLSTPMQEIYPLPTSTREPSPVLPTAAPEPTGTPVLQPTVPPSPTPWVVQPTPYAPVEPLPAGLSTVAYAVKRGRDPVQLWVLHHEQCLLQEELLLDTAPAALESKTGLSGVFVGYMWVDHLAYSPDNRYLVLSLQDGESAVFSLFVRIADGKVYMPVPPRVRGSGFLDWIPNTEWFVTMGSAGANWGTMPIDGPDYVLFPIFDVVDAAVSLDGKRIIFSTSSMKQVQLGAIDVDGSNVIPFDIPDPKPGALVRDLTLSPDGGTCALTWVRQGGAQIWIMDADGSNQQPLGPAETFDFNLDWSPDGRSVAFTRRENPEAYVLMWHNPADLVSSLWIVDTGSGQEQLLLSSGDQYAHWSPQWLPDGSGLVFLSDRGGEVNLWFIRRDGTGLQQLTRQGGLVGAIAVLHQ